MKISFETKVWEKILGAGTKDISYLKADIAMPLSV